MSSAEHIDHKEEKKVIQYTKETFPTGIDDTLFTQLAQKYAGEQGNEKKDIDAGGSFDLYKQEIKKEEDFQTFIKPFESLAADATFGRPLVEYILEHSYIEWEDVNAMATELEEAKQRKEKNKQEAFHLVGEEALRERGEVTGEVQELLETAVHDGDADEISDFFAQQKIEAKNMSELASSANTTLDKDKQTSEASRQADNIMQGKIEKTLGTMLEGVNADVINNLSYNILLKHKQDVSKIVAERKKESEKEGSSVKAFTEKEINALYNVDPLKGTHKDLQKEREFTTHFVQALQKQVVAHQGEKNWEQHLDTVPILMDGGAFLKFAQQFETSAKEKNREIQFKPQQAVDDVLQDLSWEEENELLNVEALRVSGTKPSGFLWYSDIKFFDNILDDAFLRDVLTEDEHASLVASEGYLPGTNVLIRTYGSFLDQEIEDVNMIPINKCWDKMLDEAESKQMTNKEFLHQFLVRFFDTVKESIEQGREEQQENKEGKSKNIDAELQQSLEAHFSSFEEDGSNVEAIKENLMKDLETVDKEELVVMKGVMDGLKQARSPDMTDKVAGFMSALKPLFAFFGELAKTIGSMWGEIQKEMDANGLGEFMPKSEILDAKTLKENGTLDTYQMKGVQTLDGRDDNISFGAMLSSDMPFQKDGEGNFIDLNQKGLSRNTVGYAEKHGNLSYTLVNNLMKGLYPDEENKVKKYMKEVKIGDLTYKLVDSTKVTSLNEEYKLYEGQLLTSWGEEGVKTDELSDKDISKMMNRTLVKGHSDAGLLYYKQAIVPTLSKTTPVVGNDKTTGGVDKDGSPDDAPKKDDTTPPAE